jgi:hypothetical protein
MRGRIKNQRGQVPEYLMWLLIALAALVVMVIFVAVLKGTGTSFIDKIKSLFLGR